MGRGDRKTRKGKTAIRSYGNVRPHAARTTAGTKTVKTGVAKPTNKSSAPKKATPAAKKAPAKKSA